MSWNRFCERQFAEHSYGFRPNRGCKDTLRRVDRFVKAGYKYTVNVDLKSYFDTIPQDRLVQELPKYVADNSVIGLVEKFLQAEVLDGLEALDADSEHTARSDHQPLAQQSVSERVGPPDGRRRIRDDSLRG